MTPPTVPNPYLEEFRAARHHPDREDWDFQWSFAHRYSWSVPTSKALVAIKLFATGGVVEIGAGTGYWANLLRGLSVDVVAYDAHPVETGRNGFHSSKKTTVPVASFTRVLRGGATACSRHPGRALMLCWPPHDWWNPNRTAAQKSMSDRALASYRGDQLIYIGQKAGGLTGSKTFHEMLSRDWVLARKLRMANFPGKPNALYLYTRRSSSVSLDNRVAPPVVPAVLPRSSPKSEIQMRFTRT